MVTSCVGKHLLSQTSALLRGLRELDSQCVTSEHVHSWVELQIPFPLGMGMPLIFAACLVQALLMLWRDFLPSFFFGRLLKV